ncbi:hypothetical protein LDENG_00145030 [Lucifuga dentata]|nr:hypothetical protein LDENG_00145030 [Lucifuga dentata]
MSAADQSLWCPTSVQVTVLQARGLRIKGKSGTNDAYAIMQVGKEKYATAVVEKCVAPVWKEEATFDLPLNQTTTDRGALQVHVLHRALVGPDKLLGQTTINLLQLSEDQSRNKTEWFKLLDKAGKSDKDRGEVLLDIQFMRNNMTASMVDLSAAGKQKSRLGKFKDKVRSKKKEELPDASSSAVPSFQQILTDSEEEGNGDGCDEEAASKDEKKKKKKQKLKSLFTPKSNLQRSMSQSMSVLPAKNSSLSGSVSSGLNVDSSEGKKKFKFMIHKRSGSSDSKDSQGSLSIKHGSSPAVEQSNLCVNGSHIYCEEPQPRTSRINSAFSLSSSSRGSTEDLHSGRILPETSVTSYDSLKTLRQYSARTEEEKDSSKIAEEEEEETAEVQNMKIEKDEKRDVVGEEEKRMLRKTRLDESKLVIEQLKRSSEERKRMKERVEDERRQKEEERVRREEEIQRLSEEKRRIEEQERKRIEEEERIRIKEERVQEEKRKRQEEDERIRIEEERVQEEKRREEEDEKIRRQEEERERLAKEKRQLEEQERRRVEKEEKIKREEQERMKMEEERLEKERRRLEEEEKVRRQEEERERLAEEKRRLEEQERRKIEEEEKIRKEQQERIRMENERAEEERRRQEEEERAKKEKEEYQRLIEEKRRQEEQEKRRIEEEEKIRREEEKRRMEEERKRRQEEEERARRQEEEHERLAGQKRKLEEQERKRLEEEKRAEKERIRIEEERAEEEGRRREEEDRARREQEEQERLIEEKKRVEEEKRRIEEEKKIRREEEEERVRLEKAEKERKEEEENRAQREFTSTNPFDEDISNNPFEENPDVPAEDISSTAKMSNVQQRYHAAVPSMESKDVSLKRTVYTDEKERSGTQREKRLAPLPPGMNQSERRSQKEQNVSILHVSQSKDKDVRTASVSPQCLVQMIPPQTRSPSAKNAERSATQSVMCCNQPEHILSTSETSKAPKHNKHPAPTRPRSSNGGGNALTQSAEASDGNNKYTSISLGSGSAAQQIPVAFGLNPFDEDDEIENQVTDQEEITIAGDTKSTESFASNKAGSLNLAAAVPQIPDKDAVSQTKIKSSKMVHAPLPPAKKTPTSSVLMNQNSDEDCATDVTLPDNSVTQRSDTQSEAINSELLQKTLPQVILLPSKGQPVTAATVEEAGGKRDEPPLSSRRLLPVKPLNPVGQDRHEKTKVNEARPKGLYSQLTQQELISLVLKQEKQLSERDQKISALEEYIDNLLVRVMEDKPSILMSVGSLKC